MQTPDSGKLQAPAAFLIDLDGTLVDTLGDFHAVLGLTLGELGLPPVSRAFIELTVGQGSEHLIRAVLAEVGGEPGLYERAWGLYQQHYSALNGRHAKVYPGVIEGLERLRALGRPMACLTNKPGDFARGLLASKQLDRYFDRVCGGDEFARKKPDPLPLVATCAMLGVAPQRAWMIGDSSNDARAAAAAGCGCVLVTYGYNHGEPIGAVPALQHVDSLAAIAFG